MSNKKPKIVITDCDHPSVEIEKQILSEIDPELILAYCNTEDEVIEAVKDADGIINQYAPITRRVQERLGTLLLLLVMELLRQA